MTENEWTELINDKLSAFLKKNKLCAKTFQKIPYSFEIDEYTEDEHCKEWVPDIDSESIIPFETDLVIYEENDGKIKPRVVIEAKLGKVTTHDAITYSYKAEKHKAITPYLRYGIMIGDRKHYPLPGRLFRHGTNFDFMFSFTGTEPDRKEWKAFTEMLEKEVEYSRLMEEMLRESRSKKRKRYYMLQKQLVLKESEE